MAGIFTVTMKKLLGMFLGYGLVSASCVNEV